MKLKPGDRGQAVSLVEADRDGGEESRSEGSGGPEEAGAGRLQILDRPGWWRHTPQAGTGVRAGPTV